MLSSLLTNTVGVGPTDKKSLQSRQPEKERFLDLFEVQEIMVLQIIITVIVNVINFKQLSLGF